MTNNRKSKVKQRVEKGEVYTPQNFLLCKSSTPVIRLPLQPPIYTNDFGTEPRQGSEGTKTLCTRESSGPIKRFDNTSEKGPSQWTRLSTFARMCVKCFVYQRKRKVHQIFSLPENYLSNPLRCELILRSRHVPRLSTIWCGKSS